MIVLLYIKTFSWRLLEVAWKERVGEKEEWKDFVTISSNFWWRPSSNLNVLWGNRFDKTACRLIYFNYSKNLDSSLVFDQYNYVPFVADLSCNEDLRSLHLQKTMKKHSPWMWERWCLKQHPRPLPRGRQKQQTIEELPIKGAERKHHLRKPCKL